MDAVHPTSLSDLFQENKMSQAPSIYMCRQCGYLYDLTRGEPLLEIPAGTPVPDFPEDWKCPECGANVDCLEEIL